MRLYATITSDRGKPIAKASNESINITFTKDRKNMFDIVFDGDKVKVMSYCDAAWNIVEYMQNPSCPRCGQPKHKDKTDCRYYGSGVGGNEI